MQLSPADRDSVLDERIEEWVAEGRNARAEGAQFLACVAEETRAHSFEVTRACQGEMRNVQAPAALGQVILRAGRRCAGVDMY